MKSAATPPLVDGRVALGGDSDLSLCALSEDLTSSAPGMAAPVSYAARGTHNHIQGEVGPAQNGSPQKTPHDGHLLRALQQDRDMLLGEFRSSFETSARVQRILASEKLQMCIEQSAAVFKEIRATSGSIHLPSIEERFDCDTRAFLVVTLQHGLVRTFNGLAREFERVVREFNPQIAFSLRGLAITADPHISLDGEWGAKSAGLRDCVRELMYRLSHFEYGRSIQVAPHGVASDGVIDATVLGAMRWFSPRHAALMVPLHDNASPVEEFRALRVSGRRDAGFSAARVSGISFVQRMTPHLRSTPDFVKKVL